MNVQTVESDCQDWAMAFEVDFDGIYPVSWKFCGLLYWQEPPEHIREELERKAYSYYHERRSGGCCDEDER